MWARALALSLVVLASGPAWAAEPLFRVEGNRAYIPPPPGTPTRNFDVEYSDAQPWKGGKAAFEDLKWRAFPEPVTLVSVDEKKHAIRITTTEEALSNFGQVPAEFFSLAPKAPALDCEGVFAAVRVSGPPLEADDVPSIKKAGICPFAAEFNSSRQLIVEGLDKRGKRLFVALSDDPRWSINESIGADGKIQLEGMGRKAEPSTYVSFRAPIDERLKALRVWQVDDNGKPFRLGDDVRWENVRVVK